MPGLQLAAPAPLALGGDGALASVALLLAVSAGFTVGMWGNCGVQWIQSYFLLAMNSAYRQDE